MRNFLLFGWFVLGGISQAGATISVYNSQAAFNEATDTTLVNFAGLGVPVGGYIFPSGPLTVGALTFSATNGGFLAVVSPSYYPPEYDYGNGTPILIAEEYNTSILVSLPAGTSAVSETVAGINTNPAYGPEQATVKLSNGFSYDLTVGSPSSGGLAFVGFTSSGPAIASIDFSTYSYPQIATVEYGTATTPEPTFFAILGLGLAGMFFCSRRIAPRRGKPGLSEGAAPSGGFFSQTPYWSVRNTAWSRSHCAYPASSITCSASESMTAMTSACSASTR